jgi:ribonuclease P protein component
VHSRYGILFILANQLPNGRLGIAATKKLGGAVERNRAKRLIREVFRRNKLAPGFDVVVVPKRELLDASLTALEADYRQTLERTLRRSRLRAGAAQRL